MNILLFGKNGQLGRELQRVLPSVGEMIALGRSDLELFDLASLRARIRSVKPDIIVNAAAYTWVDRAESEPERAMEINAVAPGVMAQEAKRIGALLVHYSTDYVFDGKKSTPYLEEDEPSPINVYGQSKLKGEKAVQESGASCYIFRSSWIYGIHGQNFLLTLIRLAMEKPEIRVVSDQIGAPTWARTIAHATQKILQSGKMNPENSGIYHLSAGGQASWYRFAQHIVSILTMRLDCPLARVVPIPASQYPSAAVRPANSLLSSDKLERVFGIRQPHWEADLETCMQLWFEEHVETRKPEDSDRGTKS
ncbi:MAG: dTDP-4-dehydrorhamnose reductase [Pseudomonadota bacterium]|nr:dTDP-4-dehydrorhamnose reductase [Pseudomonadota bacterium]